MPRRTTTLKAVLAAALIALPTLGWSDSFSGHGWFWYQMPPPPPKAIKKKPVPVPKPVAPPVKPKKVISKPKIPPFSVAWIRKNRHEYLVKAINDPTPANVATYMYINKAMFDRAQNFADMFYYDSHFNAALNPTIAHPTSEAGLNAFYAHLNVARKDAFHYMAKHMGIFLFFSSDCPYCKVQYQQLAMFLNQNPEFKHDVRFVSMDGKPLPGMHGKRFFKNTGQAKFLHLIEVPALVLALPPKTFIVLTQGEAIDAEIRDQLLRAAVRFKLVPTNLREAINPYERGVISTKQFQEASKLPMNTPQEISSILRKDTLARYKNW